MLVVARLRVLRRRCLRRNSTSDCVEISTLPPLQALLEAGANAQAPLPGGKPPLHVAAASGHLGVLQLLLEVSPLEAPGPPSRHPISTPRNPCPSGAPPLRVAAASGHLGVLQLLLEVSRLKAPGPHLSTFHLSMCLSGIQLHPVDP
eukprot:364128-Prorocentrum_minimum.AAC.2